MNEILCVKFQIRENKKEKKIKNKERKKKQKECVTSRTML